MFLLQIKTRRLPAKHTEYEDKPTHLTEIFPYVCLTLGVWRHPSSDYAEEQPQNPSKQAALLKKLFYICPVEGNDIHTEKSCIWNARLENQKQIKAL